tara:strand:- start:292 stop:399 length:108 start_codon:yes stop_codon:yes gene_type:complete
VRPREVVNETMASAATLNITEELRKRSAAIVASYA